MTLLRFNVNKILLYHYFHRNTAHNKPFQRRIIYNSNGYFY